MKLIAWSQNMTPETAKAAGAILVSKDQLFEQADILTIHLVLSSRTRGLGRNPCCSHSFDLARMNSFGTTYLLFFSL
jgi:hypothetical protein